MLPSAKLLTSGKSSPKLIKSDEANLGYLSTIQYFAPHRSAGPNVCVWASPNCIKGCLNKSGRGATSTVQRGRINRTNLYFNDRKEYKRRLVKELTAFCRKCEKLDKKPAFRPNGLSDIPWEVRFPEMFTEFSHVKFYDYTKGVDRMLDWCDGKLPSNYHLTFSRSECNDNECVSVLRQGGNVAVVFSHRARYPHTFMGNPVFDGDNHDLRFLDPFGICGLYAKGPAKKDKSGFVVQV